MRGMHGVPVLQAFEVHVPQRIKGVRVRYNHHNLKAKVDSDRRGQKHRQGHARAHQSHHSQRTPTRRCTRPRLPSTARWPHSHASRASAHTGVGPRTHLFTCSAMPAAQRRTHPHAPITRRPGPPHRTLAATPPHRPTHRTLAATQPQRPKLEARPPTASLELMLEPGVHVHACVRQGQRRCVCVMLAVFWLLCACVERLSRDVQLSRVVLQGPP